MATPEEETELRTAAAELADLMQRLSRAFQEEGLTTDCAICASMASAVTKPDTATVAIEVIRIRRAARAIGNVMHRTQIGDVLELRRVLRAYMRATDPFLEDTKPIVVDDE